MDSRRRDLLIPLVLAVLTLALLFGPYLSGHRTVYPLWPIGPASPIADHLAQVWTFVSFIGAGVFILVGGLMFYAIMAFARRGPITDDEPEQVHGNQRLEVTWTLIPILIVTVMFAVAVSTLRADQVPATLTPRQTPGLVQVNIRGYQWGWAYTFPQAPGLSVGSGDLHLPVGHMIEVSITSSDVVHDWWVPALDAHIDAYPNHVQRSWYQLSADSAGQRYFAQCSKFCGLLHWQMHNDVVADAPATFARWALAHGARRADLNRLLNLPQTALAVALQQQG